VNKTSVNLDYPVKAQFYTRYSVISSTPLSKALHIINCISDILNYPSFTLINFSIDLVMLWQLKKTLDEKLNAKKSTSTTKSAEVRASECENVMFKARLLVILNTVSNLIFKLPVAANSIISILWYTEMSGNKQETNNNGRASFVYFICYQIEACEFIDASFNTLYYLSLSFNFFFLYKFDKCFRTMFRSRFLPSTINSTKNVVVRK
jgi:hypothetical protein